MSSSQSNDAQLKTLSKENPLINAGEYLAVFGAGGQIGFALRPLLDALYPNQVIYCDAGANAKRYNFVELDITNENAVKAFIKERKVKAIINLAALLSVATTGKPEAALNVNLWAAINLMKIAGECGLRKLQIMSSMAAQEFDAKPHDTKEVIEIKKSLQKQAAVSLMSRPDSMYGLQKLGMEVIGEMYSRHYGLDVSIPRLSGVLNCHIPWPSDGTTEELDKLVVACAEHAVYGDKAPHLTNGKYLPGVSANITFDMVDGRTLLPVTLLLMHQDLRTKGAVHNISEYVVSMGDAAAILKEVNPAFPVEFAASALDKAKMSNSKIWAISQDTTSTEALIGKFKQFTARQSILDHFHRVKKELETKRAVA